MSSPIPETTPEDARRPLGETQRVGVVEILYDAETQEILHAQVHVYDYSAQKVTPIYSGKDARRACSVLGWKAQEEAPLDAER